MTPARSNFTTYVDAKVHGVVMLINIRGCDPNNIPEEFIEYAKILYQMTGKIEALEDKPMSDDDWFKEVTSELKDKSTSSSWFMIQWEKYETAFQRYKEGLPNLLGEDGK